MAGLALLIDTMLHLSDAVWVGRYFAIPEKLLILASARHSLRMRKSVSADKRGELLSDAKKALMKSLAHVRTATKMIS